MSNEESVERQLRPTSDITVAYVAIQAGIPTIIWGPPGIGKTARILALAEAGNYDAAVVIASTREPTDFAGLPVIDDKAFVDGVNGNNAQGVSFAPPGWAKMLARSPRPMLILDELSCAPPAVQAAALRLVQEKVCGDLRLPDNLKVVAMANPPEQAAGGWELAPPMANRFFHINVSADLSSWMRGMIEGEWEQPRIPILPENWLLRHALAARGRVASFVQKRPDLLIKVPDDASLAGMAWPSPRTWEMTSILLAAANALDCNMDTVRTLVAGCIGESASCEYMTWNEKLDLIDPEEILKNPKSWEIPKRGDRLLAALTSMNGAVGATPTTVRWTAAWHALYYTADKYKDVAYMAARALVKLRQNSAILKSAKMPDGMQVFAALNAPDAQQRKKLRGHYGGSNYSGRG